MKKKAAKKVAAPAYSATIKVLGRLSSATGHTAAEAIANIKLTGIARGMSVLTVSNGSTERARIIPAPQTMRLFSPSALMREIALKNTSLRFADL